MDSPLAEALAAEKCSADPAFLKGLGYFEQAWTGRPIGPGLPPKEGQSRMKLRGKVRPESYEDLELFALLLS